MLLAFLVGGGASWPTLAPDADFPTDDATAAIASWSTEPRPARSAAHARVVDDLAARLVSDGFQVDREAFGDGMTNVVARAPGAGYGGVWLVAHSDSVRVAPGAADDGLGLGVVMTAARILSRDGVPPDLHVLITDGEELGLLGAKAFVAAHPEPRLVLNVEARGSGGPGYMFQTAGPMMSAWSTTSCRVQTTSLARAVYELLPNDTDFTVFRGAGAQGYDFALIHRAEHYHMPTDTAANLDPRSVGQVGACVLDLTRTWLGRAPPAPEPTVWLQALGRTWLLPSIVVRALGFIALLRLRPSGRGVLAWLGAVFGAAIAGLGAEALLWRTAIFRAGIAEMPMAEVVYAFAGLVAIGMCAVVLGRATTPTRQGFAATTGVVGALVAVAWPEVGYALLPGSYAVVAGRHPTRHLAAAVAGVTLTPVLYAIFPALTTRALPVLCVAPILLLGWLVPIPGPRQPGAGPPPPAP